MKLLTLCLLAATACGGVRETSPDSGPAPDAPASADAPPPGLDAAPPPTALAADGVTSFAALDGTATTVPFIAVAYDDGAELGADGRFTPHAAGDYEVCAALAGPATLGFALELFVDDTRTAGLGSGTGVAAGCTSLRVTAGQIVDVRVTQHSGAAATFTNDPYASWLTIHHDAVVAEATIGSPFTFPTFTFTQLEYASVVHDDLHELDPATGKFTAAQVGDYRFCASLAVASGVEFEVDLYKNGARERALVQATGQGAGCRSIRLAAGDAVTMFGYQATTATTVAADPIWSRLTVAQVTTDASIGGVSSFTLPATGLVVVPYSDVLFNSGNYDMTASQYTVAADGDFEVCASMPGEQSTSPQELDLFRNGARDKVLVFHAYGGAGCRLVRAVTGDELQIEIGGHYGVAEPYSSDPNWSWLTVRRLP